MNEKTKIYLAKLSKSNSDIFISLQAKWYKHTNSVKHGQLELGMDKGQFYIYKKSCSPGFTICTCTIFCIHQVNIQNIHAAYLM